MIIVGVDEAGRGPLAGPVVAAAVILHQTTLKGIEDSKRLTPKKRAVLASMIQKDALDFAIGFANVQEIDRLNILQATLLAMKRAVLKLRFSPEIIIVDGPKSPNWIYLTQCCVKADQFCLPVSAASILAKTTRDQIMQQVDRRYPQYGFAQHKGYDTLQHRNALRQYGVTPLHRRSFKPCQNILQSQLNALDALDLR